MTIKKAVFNIFKKYNPQKKTCEIVFYDENDEKIDTISFNSITEYHFKSIYNGFKQSNEIEIIWKEYIV